MFPHLLPKGSCHCALKESMVNVLFCMVTNLTFWVNFQSPSVQKKVCGGLLMWYYPEKGFILFGISAFQMCP